MTSLPAKRWGPGRYSSALAVLTMALAGCASSLQPRLVSVADLERPAAEAYPDADAVVLLREVEALLLRNLSGPDRSQWHYHQVIAVLTEKGRDSVDFRFPFPSDATIVEFAARTIGPDGSVTPVERTAVKDDEGRVDDDSGYRVRTFAFPNVEVGSVVEASIVVEMPWVTTSATRFISDKYPTKAYRVRISGNSDVYYQVRSYNVRGAKPWRVERGGPGWQLIWGFEDVPARSNEKYQGPAKAHEPYWTFGVKAVGGGGQQIFERDATWDSAYQWRAKRLYSQQDEYFEGFDAQVDVSRCKDAPCKISAALDWLREELPFRGFKGYPGSKAKAVLARKEASGVEKTRILQKLLADWGIQARFAFFHPYLYGKVDRKLPERQSMPRLALYIPAQADLGLTRDVWVDPACEYCRLGQIPYWLKDTTALRIDYTYKGLDTRPTFSTKFVKVTGEPSTPMIWSARYEVDVQPTGAVKVAVEIEREGWSAQRARQLIRERTPEDWQTSAETLATTRIKTAKVDDQTPYVFDADAFKARRTVRFSAPGFAASDGDTLLLPLSFFYLGYDDTFGSRTRTRPIYFSWEDLDREVAVITIPEGYRVKSRPESGKVEGPLTVEVKVSQSGRTVRVERNIRARPGRYARARYGEIRAALQRLSGIKSEAIVFVRQDAEPVVER